jgi:flagellar protein FliL
MKLVRKVGLVIAAAVGSLFSYSALASGGGGDTFKEGVNYIAIKPPLVVNYGGVGRVKYIKAELSLRTEDIHSAQEVAHHMPLVRDTLIMLISSVTDEQMASAEGKEQMRVEALAKINAVLDHALHPAAPKDAAHAKPEKHKAGKAKKGEKSKDEHEPEKSDEDEPAEHKGPLVSDLLFDNLVVQK